MPNPTTCCPNCGSQVLVNTPGGQGIQGAPGQQGVPGPQGLTGPVGLTWIGTWSSIVNYATNNATYYGGSAWVALQPSLGVIPVAGAYWSLLALGQIGVEGPQGTLSVLATYGSSSTSAYAVTESAALINMQPTPPAVNLLAAGTYLIFARLRFDGAAVTLTTQSVNFYVYDFAANAIVPNTERSFAFSPVTTITGTLAEVTTPVVEYALPENPTTLQLWAVLTGAPGAGSVTCVEADIVAVKIN